MAEVSDPFFEPFIKYIQTDLRGIQLRPRATKEWSAQLTLPIPPSQPPLPALTMNRYSTLILISRTSMLTDH